ncbi:MAG: DUF2834 domain-containing protein [Pseudomonadota bacterium]|nr:DUF2834 domain-containing protein [Pseudomonadota bacterium]
MKRATWKKWVLWMLLIDFGLFSGWVMWQVGYWGIWQAGLASPGAMQILLDLVIAGGLICCWIVLDARQRGVNPWPWVLVTFAVGSIAPLVYLLWREYSPQPRKPVDPAPLASSL